VGEINSLNQSERPHLLGRFGRCCREFLRPNHESLGARNRIHQCPRFLIAIVAFVGVLVALIADAQSSAGTVRWAAGNGYPPGPYSSPDEACATVVNGLEGPAEGWGPNAYFLNSDAVANPAGWNLKPIGGYPYSATYCNFTQTIYACGESCPHVMQITNGLPYVYAISPPAKATIVTLSELIMQSQVSVYGHVGASTKFQSPAPSTSWVRFEASQVLKGQASIRGGVVPLCNSRPNEEWPDMSTLAGENILFLARHGDCFNLSHNYRSLANVHGDQVSTMTIGDQPNAQPLDVFVKKVRALVSEQARAAQ